MVRQVQEYDMVSILVSSLLAVLHDVGRMQVDQTGIRDAELL